MLNAISWQQYLTAILLMSVAWYAYVGLRFYQPEIQALLKIKPKANSVTPPVANQMTAVMGKIRPDADTGVVEAEELVFGNSTPDDISDQTLPNGPADDLLAEAQILVAAYGENDDKPGFIALLNILVGKYEVFADEISLPPIIDSLKQLAQTKLPFQVNDTEWPLKFDS
jgi:hypothetical protein